MAFALLVFIPVSTSEATTCVQIPSSLSSGSSGSTVMTLQNFLIQGGYLASGYSTGYFGNLTRSAVINFQRDLAIIGSTDQGGAGIVGPRTRQVISLVSCNGAIPTTGSFTLQSGTSTATTTATTTTTTTASSTTATTTTSTTATSTTATSTATTTTFFKMSDYWSKPTYGSAHLKYYSTDYYGTGASNNSLMTKTSNLGSRNYSMVDLITSTSPAKYVSTRYINISTSSGHVTEYRDDDAASGRNLVYKTGKQTQWGSIFNVGTVIESNIEVNVAASTGITDADAHKYGYSRLQVLEFIPKFKIGNTEYDNVFKANFKQYFCITTLCTGTGSSESVDYNYWNIDYWFAPNKGVIQTKYNNGTAAGRVDYLSKECTVSESQWACN